MCVTLNYAANMIDCQGNHHKNQNEKRKKLRDLFIDELRFFVQLRSPVTREWKRPSSMTKRKAVSFREIFANRFGWTKTLVGFQLNLGPFQMYSVQSTGLLPLSPRLRFFFFFSFFVWKVWGIVSKNNDNNNDLRKQLLCPHWVGYVKQVANEISCSVRPVRTSVPLQRP